MDECNVCVCSLACLYIVRKRKKVATHAKDKRKRAFLFWSGRIKDCLKSTSSTVKWNRPFYTKLKIVSKLWVHVIILSIHTYIHMHIYYCGIKACCRTTHITLHEQSCDYYYYYVWYIVVVYWCACAYYVSSAFD